MEFQGHLTLGVDAEVDNQWQANTGGGGILCPCYPLGEGRDEPSRPGLLFLTLLLENGCSANHCVKNTCKSAITSPSLDNGAFDYHHLMALGAPERRTSARILKLKREKALAIVPEKSSNNTQDSVVRKNNGTYERKASPSPPMLHHNKGSEANNVRLRKLGRVSVPELGQGTTVGRDPKGTGRGSHEAQREHSLVPKTPGERGNKLLANAQRSAKAPSGQRPGRSLPKAEEYSWDVAIRLMEAQMAELQQVLEANNLIMPSPRLVRAIRGEGSPRGDPPLTWILMPKEAEKIKANSQSCRRCKDHPPYGVRDQNYEVHTERSVPPEGIEPSENFNPPKFTMYDGKSDLRSHISHFRQMMVLWNHLDALMCRVFPSSLGDLGLKWFDKLLSGAISSFLQLFKSFMTQFVINAKAPKGISSPLTLRKSKNETLRNYNKRTTDAQPSSRPPGSHDASGDDKIPSTNSGRARANTAAGLLLYSKFGRVFASELGRGTTVGRNSKGILEDRSSNPLPLSSADQPPHVSVFDILSFHSSSTNPTPLLPRL
ncbi:hypothetical protein Acr_00g0067060 [Actinidia rufa]|uniref:Uncharacterized protein n=1 Tax=Actinidia rufa TaxID=165716 RepID=A0A7J0DQI2_9ERIC|nr:hypothetical protein Acr_00g0067060 [Actinidia rufa]